MFKPLFLLLVLAGSAQAQVPAPAASSRYTQSDTVRAIRHLYGRRREAGRNWLYVSVVGVLGASRALTSTTSVVNSVRIQSGVHHGTAAFFGVVFLAVPVAVGTSKLVRFSEEQEQLAVGEYLATGHPPQGFGRRLHPKDFR